MALGENQNRIQYTVTTSDASFDFPYKYWDDSELVVTKLVSGVESSPAFTVSPTNGDPKNGATITLSEAVENCTITIERIVAYTSDADFKVGSLSPASLTEGFDKQVAMAQQLADLQRRTISLPSTDPDGLTYDVGTVTERAGKALGFDSGGNVTELSLASTGGAFVAVDANRGLGAGSGTIFGKADEASINFGTGGVFQVKDLGITTAKLAAGAVTLSKVASAALSGEDATLVTGTKGTTNSTAKWNADGDLVDGYPVLDEDNMASDSATSLATQQSIKAYADTKSVAEAKNYAMKYSGATVFNGAMPTSFADLNLSATIGTNRALVFLKVTPDAAAYIIFRENGDTTTIGYQGENSGGWGASGAYIRAGESAYLCVTTDTSGVVEWDSNVAGSGGTIVQVLCYQVLQ